MPGGCRIIHLWRRMNDGGHAPFGSRNGGDTAGLLRLVGFVLAAVFLALVLWIEIAGDLPGDEWVLVELNTRIETTVDEPSVLLGSATDPIPLGLAGVAVMALLIRMRQPADAVIFFAIIGTAFLSNPLLKLLIARPRPDIRTVPETLSTYSFPSGHAANTAAILGALLVITPSQGVRLRVGIAGAIVLIATGFSRLAIGAHYPSDIIGGWFWIGSLIAFVAAARAGRMPAA